MADKLTYWAFLERVIYDGIQAVNRDYSKPDQKSKRKGSIAGFEACKGREPQQLAALLDEACLDTKRARQEIHENDGKVVDYWYWRCRELEIEWTCNVISAVLINQNMPAIIPPTARGVMKAAELIGTKE